MHTDESDFETLTLMISILNGTEGGSTECFIVNIFDDSIGEIEQSFSVILISNTPDVFTVAEDGGLTTITIIDNEGENYYHG